MENQEEKGLVRKLLDSCNNASLRLREGASYLPLGMLYTAIHGAVRAGGSEPENLSFLWALRNISPWVMVQVWQGLAESSIAFHPFSDLEGLISRRQLKELVGNLKHYYGFKGRYVLKEEHPSSTFHFSDHGIGVYSGAYNMIVTLKKKRILTFSPFRDTYKPPEEINFVFRHSPRRKSKISITDEGNLVKRLGELEFSFVPAVFLVADKKSGLGCEGVAYEYVDGHCLQDVIGCYPGVQDLIHPHSDFYKSLLNNPEQAFIEFREETKEKRRQEGVRVTEEEIRAIFDFYRSHALDIEEVRPRSEEDIAREIDRKFSKCYSIFLMALNQIHPMYYHPELVESQIESNEELRMVPKFAAHETLVSKLGHEDDFVASLSGEFYKAFEDVPLTLIHGDFHPGNLIVRKELGYNYTIGCGCFGFSRYPDFDKTPKTCIIDWGNAQLGVPYQDFFKLAVLGGFNHAKGFDRLREQFVDNQRKFTPGITELQLKLIEFETYLNLLDKFFGFLNGESIGDRETHMRYACSQIYQSANESLEGYVREGGNPKLLEKFQDFANERFGGLEDSSFFPGSEASYTQALSIELKKEVYWPIPLGSIPALAATLGHRIYDTPEPKDRHDRELHNYYDHLKKFSPPLQVRRVGKYANRALLLGIAAIAASQAVGGGLGEFMLSGGTALTLSGATGQFYHKYLKSGGKPLRGID